MACPTIYDRADFRLEDGLFASLAQLGQCRMYAAFGFRDMLSAGEDHELYFEDVGYQMDRRARVEDHERHYWARLLDVYCQMSSTDLNALATCRTPGAALLSVRAQLVRWRRHVKAAMTALIEGTGARKDITEHFKRAQTSAAEFVEKQRIWDGISPAIDRARSLAAGIADLRDRLPTLRDRDIYSHAATKLQDLRAYNAAIAALHFLVMQVASLNRGDRAEPDGIEEKLKKLAADFPELDTSLTDVSGWITDALSPNAARNVAARCNWLVNSALDSIAESTGVSFPRKKDFHSKLVADEYPLPREAFKPGF